jgi:predicted secreted protein
MTARRPTMLKVIAIVLCIVCAQAAFSQVLVGDVDANGTVNIIDALLIAQNYVGLSPAALTRIDLGDVNLDGLASIVDALLIVHYYIGDISKLPTRSFDYTVATGDTFTVTLTENPSTGYTWQLTLDRPDILALDSDVLSNCGTLPGSSCDRNFTFKGVMPGVAWIVLQYYRDWETDPVIADSHAYAVFVTD